MGNQLVQNGDTKRQAQAWQWVSRLGSMAIIPTLAVALSTWSKVSTHLTSEPKHEAAHESINTFMLQGGRFTRDDGVLLEKTIKEWVESRYPPQWMKDDLREIKQIVTENQLTIKELQVTVKRLEENK